MEGGRKGGGEGEGGKFELCHVIVGLGYTQYTCILYIQCSHQTP